MPAPTPTPEQVRAHRASLGVSQTAYGARLCGVALRTVQDWESGRRTMPAPLWCLARLLDVRGVRRIARMLDIWSD